jgi:DNA-damage-inducible protein J
MGYILNMAEPRLNIRIDEEIKKQADEVFHKLGLNMSAGINIYLTRVVAQQGLPFPLTLEKSSGLDKKMDILEGDAKNAVQEAVGEMKAKGIPVALYDAVKKQPYLALSDGRKQYRIGK